MTGAPPVQERDAALSLREQQLREAASQHQNERQWQALQDRQQHQESSEELHKVDALLADTYQQLRQAQEQYQAYVGKIQKRQDEVCAHMWVCMWSHVVLVCCGVGRVHVHVLGYACMWIVMGWGALECMHVCIRQDEVHRWVCMWRGDGGVGQPAVAVGSPVGNKGDSVEIQFQDFAFLF